VASCTSLYKDEPIGEKGIQAESHAIPETMAADLAYRAEMICLAWQLIAYIYPIDYALAPPRLITQKTGPEVTLPSKSRKLTGRRQEVQREVENPASSISGDDSLISK